ncbi:hypothetical protein J6590_101210 [Homalodisca vitripennis]|nr:hypothetical protein J6590_101210 [Homalodisca vitripennis]
MMKQTLGAVQIFEDRMSALPCRVGRNSIAISPTAHNSYRNLWFLMMKQILGAVPMFEDRMSATLCRVGRSGIAISPTMHDH